LILDLYKYNEIKNKESNIEIEPFFTKIFFGISQIVKFTENKIIQNPKYNKILKKNRYLVVLSFSIFIFYILKIIKRII